MLMEEFEKMTGFKPMPEEYEKIEAAYYDFDGGKEEFCRAWVHGEAQRLVDDRARRIKQLESQITEQSKENTRREKDLIDRIERLKKTIDKLEEWQPCSGGTNMEQEKYMDIIRSDGEITPNDAKKILAREFGLDPEKINIIENVATYEAGRSRTRRVKEQYSRKPAYASTDWNYIRFNAGAWCWEMVDGALKPYVD